MAEVLVLVEHQDGEPKKVTAELLTLARRIGEPSAVFLGGPGTYAKAKDFLARYGAQKVYVAESEDIDKYVVAPKAEVLAGLSRLGVPGRPAGRRHRRGSRGRRAGRGEDRLRVDLGRRGHRVRGSVVTQQVFGGSTIVKSHVTKGTPIFLVRPNSATPEEAPATPAEEQVAWPSPTRRRRLRCPTAWWRPRAAVPT